MDDIKCLDLLNKMFITAIRFIGLKVNTLKCFL